MFSVRFFFQDSVYKGQILWLLNKSINAFFKNVFYTKIMLQYKRPIYNSKIAMKCNNKVSKFRKGHQIKYPAAGF